MQNVRHLSIVRDSPARPERALAPLEKCLSHFVCNLISQIAAAQSFPLHIRQAAERLSTKITQRDRAPFTSNPIADAKLIIAYLISSEHERKS